MTDELYETNRQIPPKGEFWDTFTEDNRRRLVSIELVGQDTGDQPVADKVRFSVFDYNSAEKGNVLMVSYGNEPPLTMHSISDPDELWLTEDDFGQDTAMVINEISERKPSADYCDNTRGSLTAKGFYLVLEIFFL